MSEAQSFFALDLKDVGIRVAEGRRVFNLRNGKVEKCLDGPLGSPASRNAPHHKWRLEQMIRSRTLYQTQSMMNEQCEPLTVREVSQGTAQWIQLLLEGLEGFVVRVVVSDRVAYLEEQIVQDGAYVALKRMEHWQSTCDGSQLTGALFCEACEEQQQPTADGEEAQGEGRLYTIQRLSAQDLLLPTPLGQGFLDALEACAANKIGEATQEPVDTFALAVSSLVEQGPTATVLDGLRRAAAEGPQPGIKRAKVGTDGGSEPRAAAAGGPSPGAQRSFRGRPVLNLASPQPGDLAGADRPSQAMGDGEEEGGEGAAGGGGAATAPPAVRRVNPWARGRGGRGSRGGRMPGGGRWGAVRAAAAAAAAAVGAEDSATAAGGGRVPHAAPTPPRAAAAAAPAAAAAGPDAAAAVSPAPRVVQSHNQRCQVVMGAEDHIGLAIAPILARMFQHLVEDAMFGNEAAFDKLLRLSSAVPGGLAAMRPAGAAGADGAAGGAGGRAGGEAAGGHEEAHAAAVAAAMAGDLHQVHVDMD